MTEEQRVFIKNHWEIFSSTARILAVTLKKDQFLKIPDYMKGWGLSQCLLNMVAEKIDKAIADMENVNDN